MSTGMKAGLLALVVLILAIVGYYTLVAGEGPTGAETAPPPPPTDTPEPSAEDSDVTPAPTDPSLTGGTGDDEGTSGIRDLLANTAPLPAIESPVPSTAIPSPITSKEKAVPPDPLVGTPPPDVGASQGSEDATDDDGLGQPLTLGEPEHSADDASVGPDKQQAPSVGDDGMPAVAAAAPYRPDYGPTSPRPGPDVFDPFSEEKPPLQVKTTEPSRGVADNQNTYTVQSGDTLGEISSRLYGKAALWRRIAQANPDIDPNNLQVGYVLQLPDFPEQAVQPPADEPENTPGRTYVVQRGDTPSDIAEKIYGSARHVSLILEANPGINPNALRIGQELRIPELPDPSTATPAAAANRAVDLLSSDPQRPERMIYTVRSGDTLGGIAKKLYGKAALWRLIQEANPEADSGALQIGQKLVIPAPPRPAGDSSAETTEPPVIDDPLDIGVDPGARRYTVQEGDSLWIIAEREYGDGALWRAIHLANKTRMKTPEDLRAGQTIILPPPPEASAPGPE